MLCYPRSYAFVTMGALVSLGCGSKGHWSDEDAGDGGFADDGPSFGNDSGSDGPAGEGGTLGCDPSCVAAGGTCVNDTTCVLHDNPGNVDPQTQAKLKAGGNADTSFKWLYPYDATVFPRGLLPPTLQLSGAGWDASYLHITFPGLDYEGFFGSSAPGRILMPGASWKAVTLAASANSAVKVEVTKIAAGQVTGPKTETWSVAQGSLRGTIYYETYDSMLAGGLGSVGIMKIAPGGAQPTVLKSGCGNVCHAASANGSTLVASTAFPFGSASYDLKNNAAVLKAQGDNSFTYGGITPDGTMSMSATNYRTWIPGSPSKLYDTTTGLAIPASGWDGVITNAACPAFSPDGKKLVFNREDSGAGHTLAVVDFDANQKKFSNLTNLVTFQNTYLGWPAFTPDGKWVVFHSGSNQVFETNNNETGDLHIIDLATKAPFRLNRLDGYGPNNAPYLPESDPNLNFAPTVLPVAVGGYFWVVFTSHRSYGNMAPSKDHSDNWGKLWVAAVDLVPVAGQDPSHPAFYLDGQELAADNLRGFWVLDPCKQNGGDCKSGAECCDGFCRPADGGFACTPPQGCANEYEKCSVAGDCCNKSSLCINGHCAMPPPN